MVLGEIRDEVDIRRSGGNYTAFDIHGNELHYPMNEPPDRPVLSVVPVETAFAVDGESSEPEFVPMCDNTCPPPWNGRVHIAYTPGLQQYLENDLDPMFWVYENDSGEKCAFEPTEHEDIENTVAAAAISGTGVGISQIIKGGASALTWAYTVTTAVMAVAAYWHSTAGDDLIGIVTVPRGLDPATNPKAIMHDDTPRVRGYLYMQFRPK